MRRAALSFAVVVAVCLMSASAVFAAPVPVKAGVAKSSQFEPALNCGCHAALLEEWSVSMHAKALSDPLFEAKRKEAEKAAGKPLGAFCRKCHAPNATMAGELLDGGTLSESGSQGITCSFCHQVVDLLPGPLVNTSFLVEPNGVRRAQLKDAKAPHKTAYSALHQAAQFCGSCHNVDHPGNGMHLETAYDEWRDSPYVQDGVVCQDCHMTAQPGGRGPSSGVAAAGAPQRKNIYHMTFVGANVAQGPKEETIALLKSAAELEIKAPEVAAPGSKATVVVTVKNVGAGHYLPTGLTEVRQMWLELYFEQGDKRQKVGEHRFGTQLEDANGKFPVELWEAVKVHSDDRVPPKGSSPSTFSVDVPARFEKGAFSAALYYKSAPDELAKKAGVENPTTTMAETASDVFGSEQAMTAATAAELVTNPGSATWIIVGALVVLVAAAGVWAVARRKRRVD